MCCIEKLVLLLWHFTGELWKSNDVCTITLNLNRGFTILCILRNEKKIIKYFFKGFGTFLTILGFIFCMIIVE